MRATYGHIMAKLIFFKETTTKYLSLSRYLVNCHLCIDSSI